MIILVQLGERLKEDPHEHDYVGVPAWQRTNCADLCYIPAGLNICRRINDEKRMRNVFYEVFCVYVTGYYQEIMDLLKDFPVKFKKCVCNTQLRELLPNSNYLSFKKEKLYFVKASFLPDYNACKRYDEIYNLICVEDIPVDQNYLSCEKLNIIVVSASDADEVYKKVDNYFEELSHCIKAEERLIEALFSGKGLQHIVDISSEVLNNPLFVTDLSLKVLALTESDIKDDPLWVNAVEKRYCSYEFFMLASQAKVYEKTNESDTPLIQQMDYSKYRWMSVKIQIDNQIAGYINVTEHKKKFNKNDERILFSLSKIIACELQKYSNSNFHNLHWEYLLTDMLSGELCDEELIKEQCKIANLQMNEFQYLFVIKNNNDYHSGILPYLRYTINFIFKENKAFVYNNNLVFMTAKNAGGPSNSSMETVGRKLIDILKDNQMVAGYTNCRDGLGKIRRYYLHALKAIELGKRIMPGRTLYFYEDYAFYDMISKTAKNEELLYYCDPVVLDMLDYDKKNKTNFTKDAYIFISSGNSLKISAKYFNIHRNSMEYRIKKIEQLFNISFRDSELIFKLQLSFRILIYAQILVV